VLERERQEVAATARKLAADGLVRGTSGNISLRAGEQVAVTPTGARLEDLRGEDVTVVDLEGRVRLDGGLAPTSEVGLHLGVYARYGTGAVVHTHSPVATAVACVLDELPCIHYEMLALGGPVRVVPYATFGSEELAASVLDALEGRTAALMSNHGVVTHGGDLAAAVHAAELVEWASTVYWRAAAIGTPRTLGEEDLQAVVDRMTRTGYGATRKAEA
jgi:L-fuculose-phosphate aldolase